MIIAGIDAGVQYTKIVIMKDDSIIGTSVISTGGIDRAEQIETAYNEALSSAGIVAGDVEKVIATGKGKFDVTFADETYSEAVTAARAAEYLCPDATAVLSVGADESLALVRGKTRLIDEFVQNQKCSAGLGTFLYYLAQRLSLTAEQAGECSGPNAGVMNDGCVVFSELDALSMLNNGVSPEIIMATANSAAAVRAATVLSDLTAPFGGKVMLMGGLTRNAAFVSALENCLNLRFTIPEDAEFSGAVGAVMSHIKGI